MLAAKWSASWRTRAGAESLHRARGKLAMFRWDHRSADRSGCIPAKCARHRNLATFSADSTWIPPISESWTASRAVYLRPHWNLAGSGAWRGDLGLAQEVAAAQRHLAERLAGERAAGERDPAVDRVHLDRRRRAIPGERAARQP